MQFVSLMKPSISVDIEILRDCYESFAMYCFARYLVACLGKFLWENLKGNCLLLVCNYTWLALLTIVIVLCSLGCLKFVWLEILAKIHCFYLLLLDYDSFQMHISLFLSCMQILLGQLVWLAVHSHLLLSFILLAVFSFRLLWIKNVIYFLATVCHIMTVYADSMCNMIFCFLTCLFPPYRCLYGTECFSRNQFLDLCLLRMMTVCVLRLLLPLLASLNVLFSYYKDLEVILFDFLFLLFRQK